MNKTLIPATPVFRDVAANPYDVHALARNLGGSWARFHNENRATYDVPGDGFRHIIYLSDARIEVLTLRNWRNAR